MIDPQDISYKEISLLKKCADKQQAKFIKIKGTKLEGCLYCDNLISIGCDITCLQKSIKYWSYKLSKESNKCKGDEWYSTFESLLWRTQQLAYLKEELNRLKGKYNLDCYIKSSSNQSSDSSDKV